MRSPPTLRLGRLEALRLLRRDPLRLLDIAASAGDVGRIRLPLFDAYFLNHPDLVWDVLATNARRFMKGPTIQASKRVLGESLLTTEGDVHRSRRRLIQPTFHHDRIAGYADAMVDLAEGWADRRREGEPVDLHREMSALTLSIVGRTLFAEEVGEGSASEIGRALTEVLAQFGRIFSPLLPITERLPIPSTIRFRRARETFDRTIAAMIAERRARGPGGDDVLSLLLRARDEGIVLGDGEVRDEAVTLFLAGHETTAVALTWTWYLLSENPEAAERLRAELAGELGGRRASAADLDRLPYTDAVLRESMRVFPPAWGIGRRALEEHVAGGYRIPAGAVVAVSPFLLHRDPRWWRDPERFAPERWLVEDARRPRHAYIPFGGGPRMCIGEGFASMEARLLIATIARRWRFEHDPSHRVELQPVVTLRPRTGMPATVRRAA
jgi:cytochrome P450